MAEREEGPPDEEPKFPTIIFCKYEESAHDSYLVAGQTPEDLVEAGSTIRVARYKLVDVRQMRGVVIVEADGEAAPE